MKIPLHGSIQKLTIILSAFYFSILFFSCTVREVSVSEPVILKPDIEKIEGLFEAGLTISGVIQVEDPPNGFVPYINRTVLHQNLVFSQVGKETKRLMVHTIDGSFVNYIGQFGRGPGEYISASDFFVNDSFVYVLNNGLSIEKFKIDGEYISSMPLKNGIVSFARVGENQWLQYLGYNNGIDQNRLFLVDSELKVQKKFFDEEVSLFPFVAPHFAQDGKEIFFKEQFSNTVYSFENGKEFEHIVFDFGAKGFSKEYFKVDVMEFLEMVNNGTFLVFKSYLQNFNFLYACFLNNLENLSYHIVYSFEKQDMSVFSTNYIEDHLVEATILKPNGQLGFSVDGVSLKKLREKHLKAFSNLQLFDITESKMYWVFITPFG